MGNYGYKEISADIRKKFNRVIIMLEIIYRNNLTWLNGIIRVE